VETDKRIKRGKGIKRGIAETERKIKHEKGDKTRKKG
jgi:hypothetical protein